MLDQLSNLQQIRKPAVVSNGGIVAAQSRHAAEIGAAILTSGGDCIDTSEGEVVIGDVRLPDEVRDILRARFDYEEARLQTFPGKFASPSIVLRDRTSNFGATEVFHAWGDAVAESHP